MRQIWNKKEENPSESTEGQPVSNVLRLFMSVYNKTTCIVNYTGILF